MELKEGKEAIGSLLLGGYASDLDFIVVFLCERPSFGLFVNGFCLSLQYIFTNQTKRSRSEQQDQCQAQ